jgi:hypothetical protein
MGTLSPEAFVQLYNEMLNEGRKTGFGMKNSEIFILRTNAEYRRISKIDLGKYSYLEDYTREV